jgi:hypothetical protein
MKLQELQRFTAARAMRVNRLGKKLCYVYNIHLVKPIYNCRWI